MTDRELRAARAALASYGCHPDTTVSLLNLSENATFLVDDPASGSSVLRVHRLGYHDEREIASELTWMDLLRAEAGVRTPRVLCASGGRSIVTASDGAVMRHCVRFEFLAGREPVLERGQFASLGELTARMHQHARSWARPAWFTRFHWDLAAAFGSDPRWGRWQDGIGVGAAELAVLGRLEALLRTRLRRYGDGPGRYGLIHADTRLANLLADGGSVAVIDFDDCGFGWYLYDLGTAVSFFEHLPVVPSLVDGWLEGYRRVCALGVEDEAEIWTFIMLRRLLLVAWIGSHQAVDIAAELGRRYTEDSCDLAEWYLSTH